MANDKHSADNVVIIPSCGLIPKKTVCHMLGGISTRTLDNWREDGTFTVEPVMPPRKGRSAYWRVEQVMDWLDGLGGKSKVDCQDKAA